jgi:hypothetical protein
VSGTLDYFRGEPLEVGITPQFLFDDHAVEDVWALKRVSQVAAKFAGNPVMVPDQIGESYCYESHVVREERGASDGSRFRMWYQDSDSQAHYRGAPEAGSAEGHGDFCRYAESEDGVHWVKPKLGLLRHRGTDRNNIVLAGVGECDRSAVVLNPDPDDRERRFIMGYLDQPRGTSGVCLAYSADGIHWREEPTNPVIQGHYDCVNTPVWDPVSGHWLCYTRPTVHAFGYVRPERGWTDVDWERGVGRHHRRHVSVAVSRDLVHWGKVRTVFYPDELDADWPDIDHFRPFFHNGLFLANASYVDPSGGRFGQLRFMWSRDGFHWQQAPDRAWFIPRGPEGHFDDGWILGASAPVPVGHQMWFYYGGQPLQMQVAVDRGSAVGLAKLPRDRFVSLKAEGEPGFLLTREVRIAGNELRINCATGQRFPSLTGMAVLGDIRVELVESLPARQAVVGGRPVPGFTMEDCDVIRTNRIDHRVTWKGQWDLSELRGRPLHLRFRLSEAELFTFAFGDATE